MPVDPAEILLVALSILGAPIAPLLVATWPFTMLGGAILYFTF
jgi:hypothetical protein